MNIHNHSLWPPPGTSNLNRPANTAQHGALLQNSACAALIVPITCSPDDSTSSAINLSEKG